MIAGQRPTSLLAYAARCSSASLPIGQFAAFAGLSADDRRLLEDLAAPARSVKAQVDLVREGERAKSLFFITAGWAYRYTTTKAGGRQLSALMVPDDIANLDSLAVDHLDYGVRTATETMVVALPRDRVRALAEQHLGIAHAFLTAAVRENVILSKLVLSLGRRSAKERIAHLFCELGTRLGGKEGEQRGFDFPLTQEIIADMLGLTPVHVNRMMRELREEGLMQIVDRILTLPDPARLRRIAGFDPRYLLAGSIVAGHDHARVI